MGMTVDSSRTPKGMVANGADGALMSVDQLKNDACGVTGAVRYSSILFTLSRILPGRLIRPPEPTPPQAPRKTSSSNRRNDGQRVDSSTLHHCAPRARISFCMMRCMKYRARIVV